MNLSNLPKKIYEKLTPKMLMILEKSFDISKTNNLNTVNIQEILESILLDSSSFGRNILDIFDIDIKDLEKEIKKSKIANKNIDLTDSLILSQDVVEIFNMSFAISEDMEHAVIGTEHIILSILTYSGKNKKITLQKNIFHKFGISEEEFKNGIVLGLNPSSKSVTSSTKSRRKKQSNKNSKEKQSSNRRKKSQKDNDLFELGFMRDLNKYCLEKKEKIVGREKEIERCLQILCRKKKRNPIVIGETGVGKTSLVEGVVMKIIENKVPLKIKDSEVSEVFVGSIVAGTKYRGQFEERMNSVIKYFCSETKNKKIMFIDEIHHLVKAGSAEGSVDASSMLKPQLSDGNIQCIGATTFDDYRKIILRDSALSRRFTPVFLEETNEEETVKILSGIKSEYENFHKIKIPNDSIKKCVNLARKYLPSKHFPDKAFDILDESCSRQIIYKGLNSCLEIETIENAVSEMSNIPISTIQESEKTRLSNLEKGISQKVKGQDGAIEIVSNAIKRSRLGFKDDSKPIGAFLFVGKTGSGKTLLAKTLSEELFGEEKIIRLDMSEYMERHSVSKIIGPPPGYIGYDEGGQLTESIRKKPYSVLLFDEIEKAHKDVLNILLQVLDEGRLTDSYGKYVDFRNCIIIMTSNISASKLVDRREMGFDKSGLLNSEETEKFLIKESQKFFSPEFINRIDEIVVFKDFNKNDVLSILDNELEKSLSRIRKKGYRVKILKSAKNFLIDKGFSEKYGARPISRAITKFFENPFSQKVFDGEFSEDDVVCISHEKKNDFELTFKKNSTRKVKKK